MKEGWNDTGQKTAAGLKNLRRLKNRKEHFIVNIRVTALHRFTYVYLPHL